MSKWEVYGIQAVDFLKLHPWMLDMGILFVLGLAAGMLIAMTCRSNK